MFAVIKRWAPRVKRDAVALWFACRDPRTPWAVKALGVFVVAYALSPIDLAIRLLPPDILVESRRQAEGLDKLGRLKAPQHERCSADHRDVGGHWTDSVDLVHATVHEWIGGPRQRGKAAGFLSAREDEVRKVLEAGWNFVAVGADVGILARQSEALVRTYKDKK